MLCHWSYSSTKFQDVIGGGDLLSSNCLIWWFVFMILQLPNGRKYKKNAKMNGLIIYSKFWYFFCLQNFLKTKTKKKYQNFDYIINPFILAFFLHFRPLGSWRIMKTNPQIRQFEDNRSPPPISSKKPGNNTMKDLCREIPKIMGSLT